MKNWQKWLLTLALCVLAALGAACADSAGADAAGYSRVLWANWGVSLPAEAKCAEAYAADSGASFHGDGFRCHVYSCDAPDAIEKAFDWTPDAATVFSDSRAEAAEDWLDRLDTAAEQRPDYAACKSFYLSQEDNSELILFWDSAARRVYVLESFL